MFACEKLGVSPAAAVYIGDSPADGEAAMAAGLHSIGILWGSNGRETLEGSFDALVEDIEALAAALRALGFQPYGALPIGPDEDSSTNDDDWGGDVTQDIGKQILRSAGEGGLFEGEDPTSLYGDLRNAEQWDDWLQEWIRRFEDWWITLPGKGAAAKNCLGGIGLSLMSKLEMQLRLLREGIGGGGASGASGASGATPPAGRTPTTEGAGCEWLTQGSLKLPDFPSLPDGAAHFQLPPLPRLLPTWERLTSAEAPGAEDGAPLAVAVAGISILASVALGVAGVTAWRKRSSRPRSSRAALRVPPPVSADGQVSRERRDGTASRCAAMSK